MAHRDPLAVQALDLFVAAYGAFAGNMALATLAHGGVYIAGGIAPKIAAKLQERRIHARVHRQGRFSDLLEDHPGARGDEAQVGLLRRAAGGASAWLPPRDDTSDAMGSEPRGDECRVCGFVTGFEGDSARRRC